MTEQEWLACTNPTPMLQFLIGKACNRKLRLFACGVWRRTIEISLGDTQHHRRLLSLAERYSDGLETESELARTRELPEAKGYAVQFCLSAFRSKDVLDFSHTLSAFSFENPEFSRPSQAKLLHDLFGPLLFRQILIDPAWFKWDDGRVLTLAQTIYEERAFDQMPMLADFLTQAGCTQGDILDHCRGPGPHIKGCWLLDLLLGKDNAPRQKRNWFLRVFWPE